MENDIYYRVIHELSNKSEKDFGIKRVEDEKNKITRYITTGAILLIELIFITITSSFFAVCVGEVSSLIINLYAVVVGVAMVGVLNYPLLWKKFSRKNIIVIFLISIILAIRIIVPSKVIPEIINDRVYSLFTSWGVLVVVVTTVLYYVSYNVAVLTELLLDLAGVFLPVLPTTFGKSVSNLASETYKILHREISKSEMREMDLQYLISVSQADIDSAEIRSLPWVVLLGLGVVNFSNLFTNSETFSSLATTTLGVMLLTTGLLAIFNIARIAYFHTLIIQMSNRLLLELPVKNNVDQEETNDLIVFSNANKPGCLFRILLPWKNLG